MKEKRKGLLKAKTRLIDVEEKFMGGLMRIAERNEPEKKKKWLDALLILIAMIIGIGMRIPSLAMLSISESDRSNYLTEENVPYLYEMDSYYFARKIRNVVEHEDLIDKRDMFLPVVGALIYRIVNFFADISIERIVVFSGPILFVFSCVPVYFFVKKVSNRFGAFVASVLICITPSIFESTNFYMFDSDIFLIILPVSLFLSLISAFETDERKKRIIYSCFSVVLFLLLGFAWHSSSVYFYLLVCLLVGVLFWKIIEHGFKIKEYIKDKKVLLSVILLFCFVVIYLSLKSLGFVGSNLGKIVSDYNQAGKYPDSSMFISELQDIPLIFCRTIGDLFNVNTQGAVNRLGGVAFFACAIIALLFLLFVLFICFKKIVFKKNNKRFVKLYDTFGKNIVVYMLMVIWFVGGFIALSKGVRMVKIMALPTILLVGVGLGLLFDFIKGDKMFKIMYFPFVFALIFPCFGSIANSLDMSPGANDTLYEMTDWVKNNLDEDVKIASWWDLGYFYEFYDVDAIFDGGSQGGGYLYWVGNALTTSDSKLSAGIFKMLVTDSDKSLAASKKAVEMFDGNLAEACDFLKKILVLDKNEARKKIEKEYYFSNEDIEELLALTHPENKNQVAFVITQDMLDKLQAIEYYGNYSFLEEDDVSNRSTGVPTVSIQVKKDSGDAVVDGKLSSSDSNGKKSVINRLYFENEDVDGVFELQKRFDDPTNRYGSVVWTIK